MSKEIKKKILFVCLGNICRSPAAEFVFLDIITKAGLRDQFVIDSAGTGGWHVGHQADLRMREAASKRNIKIKSLARKLEVRDFQFYDLILTMDNENYNDVMTLLSNSKIDSKAIIRPILSYVKDGKVSEVPDPYYGGKDGFDTVLDLLDEACRGLLESILSNS